VKIKIIKTKLKNENNDLDPLRAKTKTKAIHLIQDLHQPHQEDFKTLYTYIYELTLPQKKRKTNSAWGKQKEKSWTYWKRRLYGVKFLQLKSIKHQSRTWKNKGKPDFFIGWDIKAVIMKKIKESEEIKANKNEKRQRNTMQKKPRKK